MIPDQLQTNSPEETEIPRLTHLYARLDQLETELREIEILLAQRVNGIEPPHPDIARSGDLIPRRSVDQYQAPYRRRVIARQEMMSLVEEIHAIEHSIETGSVATRQIVRLAVE